ncbi:MAG: choice-of-anchor J domain-containing protein [Flavobacteriales bacterium]|nr:choice-of-anchor J domain-containing protein [Flavobacteriales bacterium]
MPTRNTLLLPLAALLLLTASSCRKEPGTPPQRELPVGEVLSLSQLRALYTGTPVRFTEPRSVYAVVTADERNGNLYKNIFVQDDSAALNVRLQYSGGLYQGDSVRIYLPGCVLSMYQGMLQLDSVDADNNIVKQAVGRVVQPKNVAIAQVTPALQGFLVKLDSVEFVASELGLTWSDAVGQTTVNRTLKDCGTGQIVVRTSGYANFAGQPLPTGRGSFTAVVGQFNSTMQLFVRDVGEVQLTGPRCGGGSGTLCPPATSVLEDFVSVGDNADLDLSCWTNVATAGSRVWRGRWFNSERYAQGTAYQATDATNEYWLISPPVTAHDAVALSFLSAKSFWTHDPFGVFICTDFTGNNVATATWQPISCTRAVQGSTDNAWVASGAVPLAGYMPMGYTGSFVIAFRYTGSGPGGLTTTYRVDDVVIQ